MNHESTPDIAELRAHWRRLIRTDLPAAAVDHPDWPIRLDHCFARVILDVVHGGPWREAIASPAWRHMAPANLGEAIALGEAILAGKADLRALNARSLGWRGKRPDGAQRPPGFEADAMMSALRFRAPSS